MRKRTGSYYTPPQVVTAMVRLVHGGVVPDRAAVQLLHRTRHSRSIVRVDSAEAVDVRRVFHLYAYDSRTLDGGVKQLAVEARAYTVKPPHWVRSKVPEILRDRVDIGELPRRLGAKPARTDD